MRTISSERELKKLGARAGRILAEADQRHPDYDDGLNWVELVNSRLPRLPRTVKVTRKAERAIILYADGIERLDDRYTPGWAFLETVGYAATQNWLSAFMSLLRIFQRDRAEKKFNASTPINIACSNLLRCYRLVSVVPKGAALIREPYTCIGTSAYPAKHSDAGIKLHTQVKISWFGTVQEI